MKIGVLGPTRIKEFCEAINVDEAEYLYFLEHIAEYLASTDNSIVIMPAHDTTQGIIASTYKDFRGKKVYGLIPYDDKEFGLMDVSEDVADENVNCGTWRNQPEKFCEESDVLLVVGLSPGAMIEICYSKWFKVKKVFVLTEFVKQKIQPEIAKDLNIEYISIQDLPDKIK